MKLLRSQADGGRTVLVVTHSTDNLALCDQVLILAPGGLVAYFGAPEDVLTHFGCERYAEVFKQLTENPRVHADRWASGFSVRPTRRRNWHNRSSTLRLPACAGPGSGAR